MRTTYIHIGNHKTGTTSIQHTLLNQRETLEQRGFLYPLVGIAHGHFGHHNIGYELYGSTEFRAEHGGIDDLLREIGGSEHDVVLSSELFGVAAHNAERFRSFVARLKDHTPRIVLIVYLRNQASYARSLYIELLSHGYPETFDAFLSKVVNDRIIHLGEHSRYAFCYRDFLALLPPEDMAEIIVRYFDRTMPDAVMSDFLSILGLKLADIGMHAEPHENPSLSLAEAVPIFYSIRRGVPPDARMVDFAQRAFAGKRADLSPASRHRLVDAFDASNQFVNTRFSNCALASLAMEAPDTGSNRLYLENVFSEATACLLDGTANAHVRLAEAENARDAAAAMRDTAHHQRDAMTAERDDLAAKYAAAQGERDETMRLYATAAAERDELANKLAAVSVERDALTTTLAATVAERDAVEHERSALKGEYDSLAALHDALIRAHEAAVADRDAVIADRNTMLHSRSWRLTAPLRRIAQFARKR